jgi:hypothetical protein
VQRGCRCGAPQADGGGVACGPGGERRPALVAPNRRSTGRRRGSREAPPASPPLREERALDEHRNFRLGHGDDHLLTHGEFDYSLSVGAPVDKPGSGTRPTPCHVAARRSGDSDPRSPAAPPYTSPGLSLAARHPAPSPTQEHFREPPLLVNERLGRRLVLARRSRPPNLEDGGACLHRRLPELVRIPARRPRTPDGQQEVMNRGPHRGVRRDRTDRPRGAELQAVIPPGGRSPVRPPHRELDDPRQARVFREARGEGLPSGRGVPLTLHRANATRRRAGSAVAQPLATCRTRSWRRTSRSCNWPSGDMGRFSVGTPTAKVPPRPAAVKKIRRWGFPSFSLHPRSGRGNCAVPEDGDRRPQGDAVFRCGGFAGARAAGTTVIVKAVGSQGGSARSPADRGAQRLPGVPRPRALGGSPSGGRPGHCRRGWGGQPPPSWRGLTGGGPPSSSLTRFWEAARRTCVVAAGNRRVGIKGISRPPPGKGRAMIECRARPLPHGLSAEADGT